MKKTTRGVLIAALLAVIGVSAAGTVLLTEQKNHRDVPNPMCSW